MTQKKPATYFLIFNPPKECNLQPEKLRLMQNYAACFCIQRRSLSLTALLTSTALHIHGGLHIGHPSGPWLVNGFVLTHSIGPMHDILPPTLPPSLSFL